tara:strand:- start:2916 stop:3119 length:204 start_codon:yes stop_codon:yes gene_type:complete
VKVQIELDDATIRAISYLKNPNDGSQVPAQKIIQTLADDLGQTSSRPGFWESSNMQQVIDGHGSELH